MTSGSVRDVDPIERMIPCSAWKDPARWQFADHL